MPFFEIFLLIILKNYAIHVVEECSHHLIFFSFVFSYLKQVYPMALMDVYDQLVLFLHHPHVDDRMGSLLIHERLDVFQANTNALPMRIRLSTARHVHAVPLTCPIGH